MAAKKRELCTICTARLVAYRYQEMHLCLDCHDAMRFRLLEHMVDVRIN